MQSERNRALLAFVVLFAIDFYLGAVAPWWAPIVPAFLAGWLLRSCVLKAAPLAALAAWIGKAFYHDVQTGFRLSNRISGVMGWNMSPLAYVVSGLLIALVVLLSVVAGKSLRAALLARALPKH